MDLLHEKPLTRRSYGIMRAIVSFLHEKTIPQALSSVCDVFNLHFWHDWKEYEDSCVDAATFIHRPLDAEKAA